MMTSDNSASMQASSLSTLIGYITGPRAEQPVGVRVVEPPSGTRQKQRGNLYAVIELSGYHADRDVIADHLLTVIQRTYYAAKGSQSHVMIEAVRRAHQVLHEINLRYPDSALRAGVLCAALLNGRLVVVASGSVMALVRVNDQVQMFPSELRMENAGPDGDVPMQIFRQSLGRDDVMFLGGGSWLRYVPIKTLGGIVAFANADNCADAADELYAHGGESSPPGLLIVLVDDWDAPQPNRGASSSVSASGSAAGSAPASSDQSRGSVASRFGGLPTALGAALPGRTNAPPSNASATEPEIASPPDAPAQGSATQESLPDGGAETTEAPAGASEHVQQAPPSLETDDAASPVDSASLSDQPASTESAAPEDTNSRPESGSLVEVDALPESDDGDAHAASTVEGGEPETLAPEAAGAPATAPTAGAEDGAAGEPDYEKSQLAQEWTHKMSAAAAASISQTKRFLTRMLPESSREEVGSDETTDAVADDSDDPHLSEDQFVVPAVDPAGYGEIYREPAFQPQPVENRRQRSAPPPLPEIEPYSAPAPASGTRARLFVLIALLILILVPTSVGAYYWREGEARRVQAEQLTLAAGAKVKSAEIALVQDDKARAREDLAEAKGYLAEAIELDGSNAERTEMATTIELMLQDVLQVQPLYALVEPLLTFGAEARPHRVLVADSSIYVLDSAQQAVSRYPYDPSSDEVTDERPQTVLEQGQVIEGATVGTLADMAWLPRIAGVEDKPTLLVLDRNNNIFSYDPRVEGARRLTLQDQEQWRAASQVQTYNGRTYIADEGTNEIYRYSPGQSASPDIWFSNETLVNLAGTLSMEIDGDIWLLLSSGNILRYRSGDNGGEQLPFSLENSVGLADEPVDMYVTTEDRNQIYLADAGESRVLVYDKNGTYEKQLRAAEGDPLRGLSAIYIDEIAERLFLLTSSALYSHPLQ